MYGVERGYFSPDGWVLYWDGRVEAWPAGAYIRSDGVLQGGPEFGGEFLPVATAPTGGHNYCLPDDADADLCAGVLINSKWSHDEQFGRAKVQAGLGAPLLWFERPTQNMEFWEYYGTRPDGSSGVMREIAVSTEVRFKRHLPRSRRGVVKWEYVLIPTSQPVHVCNQPGAVLIKDPRVGRLYNQWPPRFRRKK
jgi:hypothetical protein